MAIRINLISSVHEVKPIVGCINSDGSCVLGRIHSYVSSNIPKKVYHIVTDNFVNLLHILHDFIKPNERNFNAFSFNSHRNPIQFAYPTYSGSLFG